MTSQSIATNIARLRADCDMSQGDLAEAANLSRVAIGKIERGEVVPQAKTLAALARALEVPVRDLVSSVPRISNVRFRVAKRANTREQILAEISTWLDAYNWLESEMGIHKKFEFEQLAGKYSDPLKLARKTRELLEMNDKEPVRDICGLLEDNGVKVLLLKKATDAFFGLSVGPDGGGPAVVVNTWDRISVERWIFTAAHELGHILLHQESFDRSRSDEPEEEEKEADQFASHLLMPDAGFNKEWEEARGLSFLQRVLKLKRIYRVSYKTILYRLIQAGEGKDIWRAFQVQHKMQFGKTLRKADEPLPMDPSEFRDPDWTRAGEPERLSDSDFLQDHLSSLVRQALEKGLISIGRAAEILGISHSEMRDRANSWVD